MAGLTDFAENAVINAFLRGTTLTALANTYIGLYKTNPTTDDAADGVEQDYLGYARVQVPSVAGNWKDPSTATQGQSSNLFKIVFPVANAAGSNTLGVFLADAPSGGNIIAFGTGLNVAVAALDQPLFDVGQLLITMD